MNGWMHQESSLREGYIRLSDLRGLNHLQSIRVAISTASIQMEEKAIVIDPID